MSTAPGSSARSDLARFLDLLEGEGPRVKPFRLFLSHTSAHRGLAEGIRDRLAGLGIDVFVAHSTITPTAEWQRVIERSLRSCDAMSALITPDFKNSHYCDQEVGFAIARDLLVIPVRQGADPHGFLASQQAIPGDASPDAGALIGDQIYDTLLLSERTEVKMAQVLVYRYATSSSVAEALFNLRCIETIDKRHWTQEMIDIVETAERENPFVREARG